MMFVVPILFSIYLVVRVNNIDERIENLIMDMRKDYAFAATDSDAERLVKSDLDNEALDDIEKSDKDNNELLSNSFASEEGITNGPDTPAISNGKKVYLTFDDGPNKYTDELLDILKEKNVKATFLWYIMLMRAHGMITSVLLMRDIRLECTPTHIYMMKYMHQRKLSCQMFQSFILSFMSRRE